MPAPVVYPKTFQLIGVLVTNVLQTVTVTDLWMVNCELNADSAGGAFVLGDVSGQGRSMNPGSSRSFEHPINLKDLFVVRSTATNGILIVTGSPMSHEQVEWWFNHGKN